MQWIRKLFKGMRGKGSIAQHSGDLIRDRLTIKCAACGTKNNIPRHGHSLHKSHRLICGKCRTPLYNHSAEQSVNQKSEGVLSSVMVERIVNDYGKFLDSPAAGAPGDIVDVQTLPWPKEQIKQAIFIALDNTSDAMMRNLLVTGLLCLPNYQAGIGETPVGIDHSKFAHITDAQELARAMGPHLEMMKKWEPLVEAEQAELRVALKSRNIAF